MNVDCRTVREWMLLELAGDLGAEAQVDFAAHLAACTACARQRMTVRQASEILGGDTPADVGEPIRRSREELRRRLRAEEGACLFYTGLDSPVGRILMASSPDGLCAVSIRCTDDRGFVTGLGSRFGVPVLYEPDRLLREAGQLREYFAGDRRRFELPVDLSGVAPFQRQVLEATAAIPTGKLRTYGELAREISRPGASRAVGNALGSNPVPIVVPCHRVVAAGGRLGGYSGGGLDVKEYLLRLEGARLMNR